MSTDDKKIFIAGGSGMAGTAIIRQLLAANPSARIRASHFRAERKLISDERVEYVQGDLREPSECRRMVSGCGSAVMAAASTGGSGMLVREPHLQVNDNLIMNARLLEAFHSEGVTRVVFIGSATVYQEFEGFIREDQLDLNSDPHPAYFGVGWVMRYLEKLCSFWHRQTGIGIVLARASNIYGPFARFDPQNSNVIPALIRKAVGRMDPFEIWGGPDVTRDVVYADDLARAVVMMLDAGEIGFDVFNVGSGIPATVGDMAECALRHAGHKPSSVEYRSDRPVTVRTRMLDCAKINSRLGWQPEVSLDEGIKSTTEWWIHNRGWWTK